MKYSRRKEEETAIMWALLQQEKENDTQYGFLLLPLLMSECIRRNNTTYPFTLLSPHASFSLSSNGGNEHIHHSQNKAINCVPAAEENQSQKGDSVFPTKKEERRSRPTKRLIYFSESPFFHDSFFLPLLSSSPSSLGI